jgi:hypothetical protein
LVPGWAQDARKRTEPVPERHCFEKVQKEDGQIENNENEEYIAWNTKFLVANAIGQTRWQQ